MTYDDLCKEVSKKSKLSILDVKSVLTAFKKVAVKTLCMPDESICIRGLVTFNQKVRNPRTVSRNFVNKNQKTVPQGDYKKPARIQIKASVSRELQLKVEKGVAVSIPLSIPLPVLVEPTN